MAIQQTGAIESDQNQVAKDQSLEQSILKQLSQFIRKQPTFQGASKLQQFSRELDLSYADTLITAAKRYFGQIFKQWSKYKIDLQVPISNFINNIHSKIHHSKLTVLESTFAPLKSLYIKTTKHDPILLPSQTVQLQETDQRARAYVKQKLNQNSRTEDRDRGNIGGLVGELAVAEAAPPVELVVASDRILGERTQNSRMQGWKELFYRIYLINSPFSGSFRDCPLKAKDATTSRPDQELQRTPEWKILELAEEPKITYRDCACCLSYVYENEDLSYPAFPQPVSYFGDINRHGQMQKEISQQMVSYLNGRGGVLLIGCQRSDDGRILAKLDQTQQYLKEQTQTKLRTYIQSISPPVQVKRQIDLSFIPVAAARQASGDPQWLPGTYILRIVVIPAQPQQTYYYNYNQLIHFARYSPRGNLSLEHEEIYQFMKRRYAEYSVKVHGGIREKGNVVPSVAKHNGPCRAVEKGVPEYGEAHFYPEVSRSQYKSQGTVTNPLLGERVHYKSVSLLVADRDVLDNVKYIFGETEKVQTVIDVAFPNQHFRLSNNTWLVWHNVKFQKLMTGIKKQTAQLKQKNNKRPVLLISTCPSLKLLSDVPLTEAEIQEIKNYAQKKSNQKVEHKQIEGYDYFKCQSSITAVLIYYYLSHTKKFKSVFQKIPTGTASTKTKHSKPSASRLPPARQKGRNNRQYQQEQNIDQQYYDQYDSQTGDSYSNQSQGAYSSKNVRQCIVEGPDRSYDSQRSGKSKHEKQQMGGASQEQWQGQQPQCIFSTYDADGNIWQYYDNGYVYFYNNHHVYLGYRLYDITELNQLYAAQNNLQSNQ